MSRLAWLLFCCFLLVMVVLSETAVTAAQPAPPVVDWRFGVIESYEAPGAADDLGVAWTRVQVHWAETQAGGPETWAPTVSDDQIDGEIAAGRLVTGLLIGIPGWARDGQELPRGLWLPHDDPGNTWAVFVRQAVGRYRGRIDHWTIWNEPDIGEGAPVRTWDGSIEDFFQLQRVAYLAAKQANPHAVIHLSAFTHFWDPGYFDRFLDVVAADPAAAAHNYYFDVATAHLYFQPNSIYDIIQSFYEAMADHGLRQPIWLAETNAPPWDDPEWPVPNWTLSVTLAEQAAFMPQALAAALAAGAERIAVFKLIDTPQDREANPEPFGLVSMNGRRRPAFSTYRVALGYLAGMTGAERERWNEVGQIRIDQFDQSTTVLFARLPLPQQAQVAATAETAVLADMWGTQRTVTAVDGLFTIDLPPALCTQSIGDYCMIGGTTYYLVQAAATGAAAPSVPPPTPTAFPTPTPTFVPTSTPVPTATNTPQPTPTPTKTAAPTDTAVPPSPPAPITNNQPPVSNPQSSVAGRQLPVAIAGLLLVVIVGGWLVKKTLRR